jgi:uncharacterized protein with HEPN domain
MPRHDDNFFLRHMLEASRHVLQFAENRDRTDLDTDFMFSLAIVRLLEVVGEAEKMSLKLLAINGLKYLGSRSLALATA